MGKTAGTSRPSRPRALLALATLSALGACDPRPSAEDEAVSRFLDAHGPRDTAETRMLVLLGRDAITDKEGGTIVTRAISKSDEALLMWTCEDGKLGLSVNTGTFAATDHTPVQWRIDDLPAAPEEGWPSSGGFVFAPTRAMDAINTAAVARANESPAHVVLRLRIGLSDVDFRVTALGAALDSLSCGMIRGRATP